MLRGGRALILDFRHALRVAREVHTRISEMQDIAAANPLVVIRHSRARALNEVVRGILGTTGSVGVVIRAWGGAIRLSGWPVGDRPGYILVAATGPRGQRSGRVVDVWIKQTGSWENLVGWMNRPEFCFWTGRVTPRLGNVGVRDEWARRAGLSA